VKSLFLATLCLAFISSPAYAKGPHGEKGDKHEKHDHDGHGRKDHDHDRPAARPAGWDKGKKTGWGNCDVPPGQAKKVGCHPDRRDHHRVTHRDRDYHQDRDHHRDDRRRPVYTHHPRPDGPTTTTTTTTTTNKGEHPFSPALRQKQEEERRRREEARLRQTK
jgi:hypothetical protein